MESSYSYTTRRNNPLGIKKLSMGRLNEGKLIMITENNDKIFSYDEALEFSKEKSKIINAYQERAEELHEFIERYRGINKPIDPEYLQAQIRRIELKYPLTI